MKYGFIENTYDKFLKVLFGTINPIKKTIINTHCKVHKFINIKSIQILQNDGYMEEFAFFNAYISQINEGAVWADQDFRSSNHFYNPTTKKGMFGRKSAMDLGLNYYENALSHWKKGDTSRSLFYFGAYLHILQDMTIPQHANVKLLDNHRQYETFIKHTYKYVQEFRVQTGAYFLDEPWDYIRFNARIALKFHRRYKHIKDRDERYYKYARCGLPLAKRTSAGAMVLFYCHIFSKSYEGRIKEVENQKGKRGLTKKIN